MSMHITKNFSINEFKKTPDILLAFELQRIRDERKKPIKIIDNTLSSANILCGNNKELISLSLEKQCPVYGKFFQHNTNVITQDYFNNAAPNIKATIIALLQCGFIEEENNNTPFGIFYKMNFNPWCAMFLHWCWEKAGVTDNVRYGIASSRESFKNLPAKKTLAEIVSGDGLFWGNIKKASGHTAMCLYNDIKNTTIYTVEGNSGNSVSTRKYAYNKISNKSREFLGGGSHHKYNDNINLLSNSLSTSHNETTF